MSVHLLDVNVLVALAWPSHISHQIAMRWFSHNADKGWATCPMVEAGYVRVISNPAFSSKAVTLEEGVRALAQSTNHQAHEFWPDDIPVASALNAIHKRLTGHQQITDAYLVALVLHHRGKLATLDKAVATWAPKGAVEVIG